MMNFRSHPNMTKCVIPDGVNLSNTDFSNAFNNMRNIVSVNLSDKIVNLSNGVGVIKPNLLIRNYDTFSKHAAYIGEFNKDKMFYLMSRGISKIDATKLMMEALLIGNGNKEEMIVKEFMNKIMEVSNG